MPECSVATSPCGSPKPRLSSSWGCIAPMLTSSEAARAVRSAEAEHSRALVQKTPVKIRPESRGCYTSLALEPVCVQAVRPRGPSDRPKKRAVDHLGRMGRRLSSMDAMAAFGSAEAEDCGAFGPEIANGHEQRGNKPAEKLRPYMTKAFKLRSNKGYSVVQSKTLHFNRGRRC